MGSSLHFDGTKVAIHSPPFFFPDRAERIRHPLNPLVTVKILYNLYLLKNRPQYNLNSLLLTGNIPPPYTSFPKIGTTPYL